MTDILPVLPGQGWTVTKTPKFATRTQRSVSGRRLALLDQPVPTWEFTLIYDLLRDSHDTRASPAHGLGFGFDELRSMMGFFLKQQGSFTPFLFDDPSDNSILAQPIGTGDGSTTTFQLARTIGTGLAGGGFVEPITAPNAVGAIYFDGVAQSASHYTVDANTGIVTFTSSTAPNGVAVTADFTYYFRCAFTDDSLDFENFLYQLWQLKQVKFESILN